jgi:3-methyladenine DNA glycosylase AlkD
VNPVADEIDAAIRAHPAPATADLRTVRRRFSRDLKAASGREVINAAAALRERGGLSRHFIACELIRHHPAALAGLQGADLERLGSGLDSWAAVDCFACYLSGPAWRLRRVTDGWIRTWARSPDRWRRRAALVSTVPLNSRAHGGAGDAARTLSICSMLVKDRDDMVVKAMSWALRELAKRDPDGVRGFLRREQARLAPRVLREVENKLRTGLKNPRLSR